MIRKINGIKIAGISCCIPKKRIINRDIKNHKNILRTIKAIGIESRPVADENISTSDLVIKSAEHIIRKLQWKKEEIDILIFVSQTPDYLTPATSGILQNKLKLKKSILVYDINLGCSGYTHGLIAISSLMKSLNLKKGLLAVGDVGSKLVHIKDNVANLLFGDAGSVTAIENKNNHENMYFDYFSDGSGFDDIIVPSHSLAGRIKLSKNQLKNKKDKNNNIRSNINIRLNGANIFNFAINNIPLMIKNFTKKIKNIKYCFLHQASKMIQDSIETQLAKKNFIFPTSLKEYGNTSSATIPITICQNYSGQNLKGYSLFCGFGVGLSISAVTINLYNTKIFKIIKL
jgi:3-oxoacyl-[acyl-carrier-protein] synthase III